MQRELKRLIAKRREGEQSSKPATPRKDVVILKEGEFPVAPTSFSKDLPSKSTRSPPDLTEGTFTNEIEQAAKLRGWTREARKEGTLLDDLLKAAEKRSHKLIRPQPSTSSTFGCRTRCQEHDRPIRYDHESLLWRHDDDGSACEQLDVLPHPEGQLSVSLTDFQLRDLLLTNVAVADVVRLAKEWLEAFQSGTHLDALAQKWALVLLAASLAPEVTIDYEAAGNMLKRNVKEIIRKLVIAAAVDIITDYQELNLPPPSDRPLSFVSERMAERILGLWQHIEAQLKKQSPSGLPPRPVSPSASRHSLHAALRGELTSHPLYQKRRGLLQFHEGGVPQQFLSDIKRFMEQGLIDRDQLIKEALSDEAVLVDLFETLKKEGPKELEQIFEKAQKQEVFNAMLRRLIQMDATPSLERLLGYIGVVGISIKRRVAGLTGFTTELLSLDNLRIARWIAWTVRGIWPALKNMRQLALPWINKEH